MLLRLDGGVGMMARRNGVGDDGIVDGGDGVNGPVTGVLIWDGVGMYDVLDDGQRATGGVLEIDGCDGYDGMGGARIGVMAAAAATMGDDDHPVDSTATTGDDDHPVDSTAGMRTPANRWNI